MSSIADIRKDYRLQSLNENDVKPGAFDQFTLWWKEAVNSEIDEVNAMTLATATTDGQPDARIVLLKGYSEKGFSFFTNYQSIKGRELEANPRACLIFFWKELERQVRIHGSVEKLADADNDEYFHSRPEGSRIGAWASPQSTVIENREVIENNVASLQATYSNKKIERPPHWGGYLVKPVSIEFWQGRPSRLHDRLLYTLISENNWKIERLAP